jgi:circadian clock protein KaiC
MSDDVLGIGTIPKLATGIPGLDHVTGGGLPEGEMTLVAGTTGTGKTVLGLQFLAAGVMQFAEPGVYVTFEQRPDKLRRAANSFRWDVGQWEAQGTWVFVDATESDDTEIIVGDDIDFAPLVARIAAAVSKVGAKRIVLDTLANVFSRLGDARRVRAELHRMVNRLDDLGVTTIVTVEGEEDSTGIALFGIAGYVADNILVLRNAMVEHRRRRTIEALKFRGTWHRTGEYAFAITAGQGLVVIALSDIRLTQPSSDVRISIGNAGLDAMCGGGPFQDSIVLVAGSTGTGKSLLALEFLAAGGLADRGLMLAYEESEGQLTRNARNWGHDLAAMQASGRINLVCQYPWSESLERHLVRITTAIDEYRPTRVAIDSLSALRRIASPGMFQEFLLELTSFLKEREIPTLLTTTTSLFENPSATGIGASTLFDSVVLLRYVEIFGELRRGITVLKMRGSDHDKTIREWNIGSDGGHVGQVFRTTRGIILDTALQLHVEDLAAKSPQDHEASPPMGPA